jgi:hypothetical protein
MFVGLHILDFVLILILVCMCAHACVRAGERDNICDIFNGFQVVCCILLKYLSDGSNGS